MMSLILAVLMLISSVPASVFAVEESYPVMMEFTSSSSGDFHSTSYYNKIYSATFLDSIDDEAIDGAYDSWDISASAETGTVKAWVYKNAEETVAANNQPRYDLYIAGEGGVAANPNSGWIFYLFSALEEVRGAENFKTSNAATFDGMFYNCTKLRSITGINWDTSNVTNMENMFRNCYALTRLDLSSFDTSKVTSMSSMFYRTGYNNPNFVLDVSNFDTSNVTNMNSMFFDTGYTSEIFELDLSSFDTSEVTDMGYMFRGAGYSSDAFSLDVSNFDTQLHNSLLLEIA